MSIELMPNVVFAFFGGKLSPDFFIRLLINIVSLLVLIRLCYLRRAVSRDFAFSFFLFGLGVYIVAHLLSGLEISLGFAFGLFAIFSMLRYRTESISIKEMTYLFLVISVSLLSAVGDVTLLELVLLNGVICVGTVVAESPLLSPRTATKRVQYERIDNIKPQNRTKLLGDLRERTGLDVTDVRVEQIDFLRDSATLTICYNDGD